MKKRILMFSLAVLALFPLSAREFHVAKSGSDSNEGTASRPFMTISKAAAVMRAGDVVTVHEGIYREWVSPRNGGNSNYERIVYRAAEGETVWIKGSEEVTGWKKVKGDVWKAVVPNSVFGDFNPFAEELMGDWLQPTRFPLSLGEVYMNNKSMYQVATAEELNAPVVYERSKDPEGTLLQWYAEVSDTETTIWANFGGVDPNRELVEINVRPAVFAPKQQGVNYITVSGFSLSQAATNWAPPTAYQEGLVAPHWSKGWIIENNEISNSKCTGISLGKERASGQNRWTIERTLTGFNRELESIFKALDLGWNKDNIGSHIIRGNRIFDCGQTGICGHLGGIFSVIENNHIHDINAKREFGGAELGCIKLHAAIDVIIRDNYFDNGYNGVWLDWQAMGTRITGNVFVNNDHWDLWTEVTHGPCLVDNNILLSKNGYFDWSQGTAFVHNYIAGAFILRPVPDRYTPYHYPHSTAIKGVMSFPGGDNRFYNNIFTIAPDSDLEFKTAGLSVYDERPPYYEGIYRDMNTRNYRPQGQSMVAAMAEGNTQAQTFQLAMHVDNNIYYNGVQAYVHEKNNVRSRFDASPTLENRDGNIVLVFSVSDSIHELDTEIITTEKLGRTYYSESYYENPDGTPLAINRDYFGNLRNGVKPTPGPFEILVPGRNEFMLRTPAGK